ncbi:type II secretion system GspH family protein [Pirellulaceae bacterium]|nr:type II secretion system GspH family protein [Pirellulaceae bacterium]
MFLNLKSQYGNRRTSGFTLLELLLVVFIMSVLAFSAVSLTDTMDSSQDQYRYERAKNQAVAIKKAIIDRVETQQVVRGFVADVGALPANMTELAFGVIVEDSVADRKIPANILLTPRYGETLNVNGQGNGDGQELLTLLGSLNLWKGFRGTLLQTDEGTPRDFYRGSYLSNLLPGKNIYDGPDKPRFDDGWGNQIGLLTIGTNDPVENDDLTHGWVWNDDANGNLTLKTLGKDGLENVPPVTGYNADLQLATISRDDWSVDASAIQVELYNDLGNLNTLDQYKFAILSYDAKKNFWQTTLSNFFQISQMEQVSTATFPAGLRVPAGTHVLLLTKQSPDLSLSTPIVGVSEKEKASELDAQVQTYFFAPVLLDNSQLVQITATLPHPDPGGGGMENVTRTVTNTWDNVWGNGVNSLNDAFTNSNQVDENYIDSPFSYIGDLSRGEITIELSASSEGQLSNQEDVDLINIQLENAPVVYRAKHIHVLPGQANTFRLNLSPIILAP